jgi:hypothetical protein
MNRTRRTMAHALRTHARNETVTERRGKGRVIDVIVIRVNGRAGADEKLAEYIRAVNFRLIGMGVMRYGVSVVMVTRNTALVVVLRVRINAEIGAPLDRPNRASVKYRQAVKNEN